MWTHMMRLTGSPPSGLLPLKGRGLPRAVSVESTNTLSTSPSSSQQDDGSIVVRGDQQKPSPSVLNRSGSWNQFPSPPQGVNSVASSRQSIHSQKIVEYPGANDVLCGRGSAANNHIGNIRFREMVKEYQSIYRSACKADKPIIALQIVLKLKSLSPPGRFLTKPPLKESTSTSSSTKRKTEVDFWIEIDEEQATRKVAQRLREKKTSLAETRRRLRFEESQRVKRQQQQQQQDGEEEEASSINVTSTGTIGHGDLAPTPLSSNKQLNLASEVIKEEGITFSAGSDDVKLPAVIVVRNTDRDSTIMMTTADEDSCGFSSSSDAYPPMKSPRCSAKDGATSTPYCDFSCFDNGIYDQQQPQERYGDIIASQTESLPAQVNIIEQEEASNNEDDDILDDDLCTAMQDDHFYYGNTATAATAAAVTKPSMFGEPEKVSTKVEYMPTAALLVSVFDDL